MPDHYTTDLYQKLSNNYSVSVSVWFRCRNGVAEGGAIGLCVFGAVFGLGLPLMICKVVPDSNVRRDQSQSTRIELNMQGHSIWLSPFSSRLILPFSKTKISLPCHLGLSSIFSLNY